MPITSSAPTNAADQFAQMLAVYERRIADLERAASRDIGGAPMFSSRYVPIAGGVVLTQASINVPTATATDITWPTEVSDPDNWISGGGAVLTVPVGKGFRYLITPSIVWSTSAVGTLSGLSCLINGSDVYTALTPANPFQTWSLSAGRTLVAGDTVKVRAYQTSGVTISCSARLEVIPV